MSAHSCETAQGRETSWAAADNDGIVIWLRRRDGDGVGERQEGEEGEQHRGDVENGHEDAILF